MNIIKIGPNHNIIKNIKNGQLENPNDFLVEGMWALEKIENSGVIINHFIYNRESILTDTDRRLVKKAFSLSNKIYEVSKKTMSRITSKKNTNTILLCSSKIKPLQNNIEKIIILDGLENPGNVGTILRTCDGMGVENIFMVNNKLKINHHKIVKASMGGFFTTNLYEFNSINECKEWLDKNHFTIVLGDPDSNNNFKNYNYQKKTALVVGNERYGISKEWFLGKHTSISIPMHGCCDSLNVSIAASILIYEIFI